MSKEFEGLGLKNVDGLVAVAHGEGILAHGETNGRLYKFFTDHNINGLVPANKFSPIYLSDLLPSFALMEINKAAGEEASKVVSTDIVTRFMGSNLDQIYGQRQGTRLDTFANTKMTHEILNTINFVRDNKTIFTRGMLFSKHDHALILQATYIPLAEKSIIEAGGFATQIAACVTREKMDVAAAQERLALCA